MRKSGFGVRSTAVAAVIVTAAAIGCTTRSPRQTRMMKTTKMTISAAQLRVQVRSLAGRFSGLMEEAGMMVLQEDEDPARRRYALLWLTNGIPAMQQALFQPDPLAALVDAQFLIAQMRGYFAAHAEGSFRGKYAELAESVLDEMESDIKLIVDAAGPDTDYEAARSFVYEKAKDYPIDSSFTSRTGSAALLAEFTAKAGANALKSLGSITETIEDLVARFDLNAEYLPKQARWHAQLLIMDEIKDEDFATIVSSLEHLQFIEMVAEEIDGLMPIVEALPDLVAEERTVVLQAVAAHLERTLAFVDQQRATLMHDDVRFEREAVLTAVRQERIAILEALREERIATFRDLDTLMEKSFSREIDKLFLRALQLIGITLLGLAALAFFVVRGLKRKDG